MQTTHRSPIVPRDSRRRPGAIVRGALVLSALALTACGGNGTIDASGRDDRAPTPADDADTEGTSAPPTIPGLDLGDDPSTTFDLDLDAGDDSELASTIAEELSTTIGFDIPPDEVQCLVDSMLDEFSYTELASFQTPDDLEPESISRLGSVFDGCLSSDTLVNLFTEQGMSQSTARCLVDALADRGLGMGDLMAAGLDPTGPAMERLTQELGEAGAGC